VCSLARHAGTLAVVNASFALLLVFAALAPLDGLYPFAEQVVGMLLPGAVLIAGLHLYLWFRPTSLVEEGARS
jgi:hypothetical protein